MNDKNVLLFIHVSEATVLLIAKTGWFLNNQILQMD